MSRLTDMVIDRAGFVIAAIALLSALAIGQLVHWHDLTPRLEVEASVANLLSADDAQQRYLARVQSIFGRTESVMVAVYWDDVFTADHLAAVAALTEALKKLDPVSGVWSLATVPSLATNGKTLDMSGVAGPDVADPEAARAVVRNNPLYADTLVSEQGDATALVVGLAPDHEDKPEAGAAVARIRAAANKVLGSSAEIRLTGPPVVQAATSDAVRTELGRILPLILVLVAVFLIVAFRSVRGVLLPLAMISVALVWILGIIVATGRSLNLVTTIVPPVVLTIGLAYAVHMLAAVYRNRDAPEPAREALREMALPLLMTGGTTAAGFLALTLATLAAVREFAWLSALGVLFCVILALTLVPAVLHLSGVRDLAAPPGTRIFRALAERLARFDVAYRRVILGSGGVLMLVAVVGVFHIQAGSDYIAGFGPEAPVRADFERIGADFGGATPLSVVVQGKRAKTFARPEMLRAVDQLRDWLKAQPEIGTATSIADYVRVLNRALNGDEQASFVIPDSRRAVQQQLLFGAGDLQNTLVDTGLKHTRIRVRATISDSGEIADLVARIRERLGALPEPLTGRITGTPVLVSSAVAQIASGQIITIGAALLVVFVLLSLLFTSAAIGALALLPNLLVVLAYFGALGLLGINLNPTTSLIACIVLGIAVDDTLYYLARFNHDARRYASESRATVSALRSVLRPVTYTSLCLVLGFLALTTSELQNQVQFGALAAATIGLAWLVDVTFTPALVSGVRIVTLWDVLRLDLGRDPQSSIPLFADLKLRQARIFALMARMQRFGAGQRVLTQGEQADDIYVVIDGELRVVVDRGGTETELARLRRGEVIGEVGHFGLQRSANVDAVTPVRLLRFNAEDLERLRRRYPRTAALVLRNLNRIQARRLAETTQRLR